MYLTLVLIDGGSVSVGGGDDRGGRGSGDSGVGVGVDAVGFLRMVLIFLLCGVVDVAHSAADA